MLTDLQLLQEYAIPVPRYTSYPTVPFWDHASFSIEDWKNSIRNAYWANAGEVSLYIHLPYCESLCTYCGCNTINNENIVFDELANPMIFGEFGESLILEADTQPQYLGCILLDE